MCDALVLPFNGKNKRLNKADMKIKAQWQKNLKSLHAQMEEARGPLSTVTQKSLKNEIDIQKKLYKEKDIVYRLETRDVNEMQPE